VKAGLHLRQLRPTRIEEYNAFRLAADAYREDGFIVISGFFSAAEVTELRRVTDQFVRNAAQVSANDKICDLEDTHSTAEPSVRRIKTPHLHHTAYARAGRHPTIVAILADLWGSVRFDTGKLNMKIREFRRPGGMAPGLGLLPVY
jgi:hypothetical protein